MSEEHGRRWAGVMFGAALAALPACDGGQSGTEGGGSDACRPLAPIGPDEKVPFVGYSPREALAQVAGPTSIPGIWFATNSRHALSVEISRTPLASVASDCEFLIDANVTVRSDDGAIDTTARVQIHAPGVLFSLALPALPSEVAGAPLWAPDAERAKGKFGYLAGRSALPSLGVEIGPQGGSAIVVQGQAVLGAWSTEDFTVTGPPTPYTPPAELAGSCGGAEQFLEPPRIRYDDGGSRPGGIEYTPFASQDAALAGEVGTWVRCLDNTAHDRAAIEILPDGRWLEVTAEGGTLSTRHGFEHEGNVLLQGGSADNGMPGLYQISFEALPGGTYASSRALVFQSETPDWPAAVYLPTKLPVQDSPSPYADGERAGLAACDSVEQGIVATPDETFAALAGSFVRCSGTLKSGAEELRFAGGSVELLTADGTLIQSRRTALDHMNFAPIAVLLDADTASVGQWFIMASRFPRKLWIQEEWGTTAAVFSAAP